MTRPVQLMIVGAQKAGTSSLIRYVGEHPRIITHTHKKGELSFFVNDREYRGGYGKAYKRYFGNFKDESFIIAAKSVGIMYLPYAVKRLHSHNPDIHIVAVLRNPVERAYSAYWFARRRGREDLTTFEQAIDAEAIRLKRDWRKWHHCAYLDRGIYHKQLITLYEHFKRNQISVFLFEDLKNDPVGLCRKLFNLFHIDSDFILTTGSYYNQAAIARSGKIAQFLISNNRAKRLLKKIMPNNMSFFISRKVRDLNEKRFSPRPMRAETRARLIEYFRPHNEKLSELVGRDLSRWNDDK